MGRPPGAPDGGMRRRYPRDWEFRDPRFEELDSEDDNFGNGVVLDPASFAAREARGFRGDELYFDGYDIGQARAARRAVYDYGDDVDSDDLGYRDQRMAYRDAVMEQEEALYQSALDRIARANSKGKTNVNLSQDELEVYQRRQSQQQRVPVVLPPGNPATPTKSTASTPKGKSGSRSNSSTSLSAQKGRTGKRSSSGLFGGSSTSSPAKSTTPKAKAGRKASAEQPPPYPTGSQPPGIMLAGPNGTSVYAPLGYHAPPRLEASSPDHVRTQSANSKPSSRSGSKHSRRDSTPPERIDSYGYPPRYYPPPAGTRPESAHSARSIPDDIDWYTPGTRHRSTSNAAYAAYPPPNDYDPPPLPAAQGQRRNVSGPPDVRYANLRRVPPSSPLAPRRPEPHAVYSDPPGHGRRGSVLGRGREADASSSSSSDDQGVQVDIVPDAGGGSGYTISRAPAGPVVPVQVASPSSNEGRRRKGRR